MLLFNREHIQRGWVDRSRIHIDRIAATECDGLISGPPCPPVSTIGVRLGEADARAEVFYVVLRWVVLRAKQKSRFVFVRP